VKDWTSSDAQYCDLLHRHPTQKPEKLLERILRAASVPGSRVLDPMCGSGTTLVVAERLGRRWVGIDSSPVACRVARKRIG
jgi:site-specific DNA-methyltransferase (adenine-specific)